MTNTLVEQLPFPRTTQRAPQINREAWIVLAIAAVFLLVADGKYNMPLASWVVPALILRFLRLQPAVRGTAIVFTVLVVLRGFVFRDIIPIPGIFYVFFLLISGLMGVVPYVLDRVFARRVPGMWSTLVFPCALVSCNFVSSFGPMGSWGSVAYTQSGDLPLLQILSVTGLWGVTFLIGWFASSLNVAWQQRKLVPIAMFVSIFLAVILFGQARLSFAPVSARTVRIASLSRRTNVPVSDVLLDKVIHQKASTAEVQQFNLGSEASNANLLDRTEQEARAGAKIIFWAEENALLLNSNEPQFFERAANIARQYGAYIGAAVATWTPGNVKPLQNKIVMITPSGAVAWQYRKARLTPGPEAAVAEVSYGKLRTIDTPYGRVAVAICFDADFPRVMAQAGALHSDIVLVAANDWRAIDPIHTNIASFRPIEQGFNLVRQGSNGLSAAFDRQGRRVSMMDAYHSPDLALVSEVPIEGRRTLYSVCGDWFPVLCFFALGLLLRLPFVQRPLVVKNV